MFKKILAIFIILFGLFSLFCGILIFDVFIIVLSLFIIGLGLFLFKTVKKNIISKKQKNNTTINLMPNKTKNETINQSPESWKAPKICPPSKIGDYMLNERYTYPKVELKVVPNDIHFDFNMFGKEVNLTPEPDNEYDIGAIMVVLNEKKIGYIPKNKLQDMIHDYQKKGNPIYAVISDFDINIGTNMITGIYIFLGFYYNLLQEVDKCDQIKTKLTKTSKRDIFENSRQENIELASEGEFVNLEYDCETESYIAYFDGSELGETSASVTKKLQEFDPDCNFLGAIDEITENDSLTHDIVIKIYLKST